MRTELTNEKERDRSYATITPPPPPPPRPSRKIDAKGNGINTDGRQVYRNMTQGQAIDRLAKYFAAAAGESKYYATYTNKAAGDYWNTLNSNLQGVMSRQRREFNVDDMIKAAFLLTHASIDMLEVD